VCTFAFSLTPLAAWELFLSSSERRPAPLCLVHASVRHGALEDAAIACCWEEGAQGSIASMLHAPELARSGRPDLARSSRCRCRTRARGAPSCASSWATTRARPPRSTAASPAWMPGSWM
jgi:hypothetical protein